MTWTYIAAGIAIAGIAGFSLFIYLQIGGSEETLAAPTTSRTTDKYLFYSTTGTYTEITGGTLVSNSTTLTTQVFNDRSIGFTFGFCGNEYTSISIATKGYIAMGSSVANSATPLSTGTSNFVLSPLGGNLVAQTGSTIRTELSGTAPNRVFTIQWKNFRWSGTTGDSFNFQIKLFETTNLIQFVYGSFTKNGSQNMQVGIRGADNTDFHIRTTTSSWSSTSLGTANTNTCLLSNTVKPASGLIFTFKSPLLWSEDFALANGTTVDNGTTAWSTSYSGSGGFSVQDEVFRAEYTSQEGVWTSQVIDISSVNYVDLSLDISGRTNRFNYGILSSGPDYIRCYYKLDGGPEVLFYEHNSSAENDNFDELLSKVLTGNSVQIIVRISTDRTRFLFWYFSDYYTIDNLSVSEVKTLYSRTNGNWRDGNSWSVTDFSGTQLPAGIYPTIEEVAIIGNGNTITLDNNTDLKEAALLEVRNTGVLDLNNRLLSMRRGGDVFVKNGGKIKNNNSNSLLEFTDATAISSLIIDDSNGLDVGNIRINGDIRLNISGSGSLKVANALAFNGTNAVVTVSNVPLVIEGNVTGNTNNTIINAGSISFAGSAWSGQLYSGTAGSSFEYSRAGNQNIVTPEDSYASLSVSGSGTKTAQASLTVSGNLTASGSASLSMSNNDLTLTGNFTNNSSGSISNIARLTLNGTSNQQINGTNATQMEVTGITLTKTAGTEVILSKPLRVTGGSGTDVLFNGGIIKTTSTNTITFANGVTSNNGSTNTNSYVDGPVVKEGNNDFIFPIGTGGRYAPLEITGLQNAAGNANTRFIAEYITGTTPDAGNVDGFSHVSGTEYWNLTRNDQGNDAQCFVRLYFMDAVLSEIENSADLIVAHHNGVHWESLGAGGVNANSVVTLSRVTNFSPFTFGSAMGLNPLPVTLIDFEALHEGEHVKLTWTTASEWNNDYFTIEHSADGIQYRPIGKVEGNGTTKEKQSYQFFDTEFKNGVNYYRLTQTDFDGASETFNPVHVNIETGSEGEDISIYPNPVQGSQPVVTLKLENWTSDDPGDCQIAVVNSRGERVFYKQFPANNLRESISLNLGNGITAGMYIVKFQKGSKSIAKKIVVY